MTRPTTSSAPPAAKGTTRRTGFDGYVCESVCAGTAAKQAASASRPASPRLAGYEWKLGIGRRFPNNTESISCAIPRGVSGRHEKTSLLLPLALVALGLHGLAE